MVSEDLQKSVAASCGEVAQGNPIVSVCLYGSRASGYAREDSDYDILLILKDYSEGVRYHYMSLEDAQLAILAVDQKAIELDAEKGALGDFVSGRLLPPYTPMLNPAYARRIELETKRRFAEEDLEDLIIEYGDLARGITIKPEYLVLARMEKRAKAYPPLRYSYVNMLREGLKEKNMRAILDGYLEVLKDLANSKMIDFDGENIYLKDNYVDKVLSYKILNKVVNLVDFSKRAFYAYITHGKAGKVSLDVVAKELASKLKRELLITFNRQALEDPKNYLFLKTERGLINLNKQDAIVKALRRIGGNNRITVKPLASALNEVYLVTIGHEKMVAKKFADWYNLKWFILNVAAYGTKIFTLSGKARLTNEYVINNFLAKNKIPVPEIVSISLQDRLLVERYVEGRSALEVVTEVAGADSLGDAHGELAFEIGRLLAEIHALNVTLGDCKPENFIVRNDGKVYVLDLEQGERHGDKAWDVAEFLYFSGHFGASMTKGFKLFVEKFIEGYSSAGEKKVLREASGARYSRVFLAWTPIPIIRGISTLLRNFSKG